MTAGPARLMLPIPTIKPYGIIRPQTKVPARKNRYKCPRNTVKASLTVPAVYPLSDQTGHAGGLVSLPRVDESGIVGTRPDDTRDVPGVPPGQEKDE
jgi:hypothetical protein